MVFKSYKACLINHEVVHQPSVESNHRRSRFLVLKKIVGVLTFERNAARGLEPKLLSLSAALGLALGVFPVCGVPLLFCAIVALVLRSNCHVPTIMLGNFVASFFELGLVVPYMRAGEFVTGGEHFRLSTGEFWEALRGHESHMLMFGMLHAIIGWTVFLPVTVAVLYICSLPIFKYLAARIAIPKLPLHQIGSHGSAIVGLDGASTSNLDCSVHA
ncbi:hypothetical protein L7F22_013097 [Adiantum nelumboides]|nr:hypothetical protein [Adiantum nelumboides]